MNNETVFELRDVAYAYEGKQTALEHVSLSIQAGERVAVLGSNGSGKSTLLKLLDGLYFATHGVIRAYGQQLTEAAFDDDAFNFAFRRRVGLVFQDTDVQLFSPSVWEEMAFAPMQLALGRQEVEARVDDALRALRIEKLRDRAPHRLSGGEKRRVALASVLTLQPEVWLLDEPTTGLDPRSQSWLIDFIAEQGQAGKTVITATHDLSIVDAIAERVFVFDESHHLAAQGAAGDILADNGLLLACNLSHAHRHRHAETGEEHTHPHSHPPAHTHQHAAGSQGSTADVQSH
ncbi:MAG: energy-coupling factor ABC transporter ATP-binding protein [Chloroflexi bacterium]|nr:energy-coupling factor ABC transporter ATP-binding protein [Chloroflexota bacterium]MCL5273527.1 energy-coupling factor ABC transporter ATP-binding protein [Chloroflexota bacterium]